MTYENEDVKTKDAQLSAFLQAYPARTSSNRFDAIDASTFFDVMRVRYYGNDWLRMLFPSLFQH